VTCQDFEKLACDYFDGVLDYDVQRQFELHVDACPECAAKLADEEMALSFVRQTPRVQPPPGLVREILEGTIGAGAPAGVLVPAGASAGSRLATWVRPLVQPIFEPRFAMSLAMAVVSFSILTLSGQRVLERWESGEPGAIVQVRMAGEGLESVLAEGVRLYRRIVPPAAEGDGTAVQPSGGTRATDSQDPRSQPPQSPAAPDTGP
jgi:hypothetical protein